MKKAKEGDECLSTLKIVVDNGKEFWEPFTGLDVGELVITAKKDGLHVHQMDLQQIKMYTIHAKSGGFVEYVTQDVDKRFAIEPDVLKSVMQKCKGTTTLQIPTGKNQLLVQTEGRTFSLKLIDDASTSPKKLNIPNRVNFKIRGSDFKNALEDIKTVASHVKFGWNHRTGDFMLFGDGDYSSVEVTIGDKLICAVENEKLPVASVFSLEQLLEIIKGFNPDEDINMRIGKDMPMTLEMSNDKVSMEKLLAPRIESE